ncbi:MAG: hypothetical protein QGH62_01795, partial [Nitrospinaceae bacterium]|nr:hypothetical protein [Nitrospinaceae bacterium]
SVDNRLMALPLSGEPEFRIPLPDNLQINWYSCVRWSPTGDHLSFAATQLAEKSQYWIVDNFTVGEKEEEKGISKNSGSNCSFSWP